MNAARHIVVMGVCACGKSTIGEALAGKLDTPFKDGDSLHPASNIEKMEQGVALEDEDRWPWLKRVGEELGKADAMIIACSSLKRSYRDFIAEQSGRAVTFLHLTGTRELLKERMGQRTGHFMPTSLLDSQLATLETPGSDERVVTVDIDADVETIVVRAMDGLAKLEKVQ